MVPKSSEKQDRLIRISLDPDGGYCFVHRNGTIFRASKSDLEKEEPKTEKVSDFWLILLSELNEAVNEKMQEAGSVN